MPLHIFEVFVVSVFALILGSFTTALTHRQFLGLSWFAFNQEERRSVCPKCGTRLKLIDLIPVFSWLFLRGKCRYCGAPIGYFYPAVELSILALCLIYVFMQGLYPLSASIPLFLALPFLVALLIIDIKTKTLPNLLVFIFALIGLVYVLISMFPQQDWSMYLAEHVVGALLYGGLAWSLSYFMAKMLKKTAMGGGDVKLMAACGLWLGVSNLANFFMLSGVLGVVLGILWRRIRQEPVFPFGPALILSFYVLFLL